MTNSKHTKSFANEQVINNNIADVEFTDQVGKHNQLSTSLWENYSVSVYAKILLVFLAKISRKFLLLVFIWFSLSLSKKNYTEILTFYKYPLISLPSWTPTHQILFIKFTAYKGFHSYVLKKIFNQSSVTTLSIPTSPHAAPIYNSFFRIKTTNFLLTLLFIVRPINDRIECSNLFGKFLQLFSTKSILIDLLKKKHFD